MTELTSSSRGPQPGASPTPARPGQEGLPPGSETRATATLRARLASLFWGQDAASKGKTGFALSRAEVARLAFLVTIPVLCWVFYTTSSGMIDVMRREPGDWVGFIGTVIGTTAILTMLAATSWSLGADLGALIARQQFLGERVVLKTAITGLVYIFVFSISAFFSFTYYYNNIFGLSSKRLAAQLQPMEIAAESLLPAQKYIEENYDAESQRIVGTPAMRAYLERIDALTRAAGNAGPALRENARKAQEELQRQAAIAAQKTAADLAEAQSAHRQIGESEGKIAAFNRAIAELEPIIKAKEEQIAALSATERQEEQLAIDASKGLDNMGAACGPNCMSHRANAEGARKRIATIRQTLSGPLSERANALKQRDLLEASLVTLRQQEESARAKRPATVEIRIETPPDLSGAIAALSQASVDIRVNPTTQRIREAKPACLLLFGATRETRILPAIVPNDFDCEPQGREALDLLAARDEVIAARAVFVQKCALDGELRNDMQAIVARMRAGGDAASASAGVNEAKQRVDACVVSAKAAGLSEAQVQDLLKRSDRFLQTRSLERNRFELAREAFLKLTPDATMALGVAIAQDAFMFVMKLLSEILKRETKARERAPLPSSMDVTDSDEEDWDTRVLKTLLRRAKPYHGAMSLIDLHVPEIEALPDEVRDNLSGLLNRLVRAGHAYVDRKGEYILDDRTLIEAETRLEAAMKRQRLLAATVGAPGRFSALSGFAEDSDGVWRRGRGALSRYFLPSPLAPAVAGMESAEE
jgi:hypothetical protein